MQRGIFVLFIGGLVLLAGCTPVDESVVKRAERSDAEGAVTAAEERGPEGNSGPEIEPSLKAFIQKHGETGIGPTARWTVSSHWLSYDAKTKKLSGSD